MINPTISLQQAWEIMNMLDENYNPIPFSIRFCYATTDQNDEDFGRVGIFDKAIMLRNLKFLDAEVPPTYKPSESEIIYARDWKFYLVESKQIKSLSHWHITHLNDMEVNFPKMF